MGSSNNTFEARLKLKLGKLYFFEAQEWYFAFLYLSKIFLSNLSEKFYLRTPFGVCIAVILNDDPMLRGMLEETY